MRETVLLFSSQYEKLPTIDTEKTIIIHNIVDVFKAIIACILLSDFKYPIMSLKAIQVQIMNNILDTTTQRYLYAHNNNSIQSPP